MRYESSGSRVALIARGLLGLSVLAVLPLIGGCASSPETEPQVAVQDDSQPPPVSDDNGAARPQRKTFPDRSAELAADATRERSVLDLLSQFRQVASNGTRTDEAVAFIDRYAEPLTQAYVAGSDSLRDSTRLALLTQLLSYEDPRTVPAHVKALNVYAKTSTRVDEAILACQAATRLPSESFDAPLLAAFDAINMPNKDDRRLSVHLARALRKNADAAWASELALRLTPPIERPVAFNDAPGVKKYQNQVYWQTTASELLGMVGDRTSARALARVLMSKDKMDVHATAELALVELGQPSIEIALSLLNGEDAELVQLSKSAHSELAEPNVYFATEWLTRLAHPNAREPLQDAWERTHNPQSKALIARTLAVLPKSERSIDEFKQTIVSTPISLTLPAGECALESLVEISPYFFDTELVPWLMDRAGKVTGSGSRKFDVQRAFVIAIAELALPNHLDAANKVSQRYGGRFGTPAFDASAALAKKCQSDPTCYGNELGSLSESGEVESVIVSKAGIMLGVIGKPEPRGVVLKRLVDTRDVRVQGAMARVLDHLTPTKDPELIAQLETAVQQAASPAEGADPARVRMLQMSLYRMQAR
ncbi:MAG TPA: hypothetical protein VHM70_18010 [Polyangiaceae bacterium]|nr:hypothetical protein [Polyangiaceae bacterium]